MINRASAVIGFSCAVLVVGGGRSLRSKAPTTLLPTSAPRARVSAVLLAADGDSPWAAVAAEASRAHGDAPVVEFSPADGSSIREALSHAESADALLVMPPDAIDVNFAWRMLDVASSLDDDPFVDVRYGIITGATPEDAREFLSRSGAIAPKLLDCLGPNMRDNLSVTVHRRLFWAGWLSGKLECRGMNNGRQGFPDEKLDKLSGYGIYHFGGHGYPDRIDQGLTAEQLSRTELGPSIAFNGACSTGVTERYFEMTGGGWAEKTYEPDSSFCLQMLRQPVLAYFAATHPDHGVPVYQEMERLFTTGCSMGEVIKHTYDAVVVGNGGEPLELVDLSDGAPIAAWGPTEIMLYGTASRVLYGDPTLRVMDALAEPGLAVESTEGEGGAITATVTVTNPDIAFSLQDTFHSDMSAQQNGFNDRIYVQIPLTTTETIGSASAVASANGKPIRSRVVGFAIEEWAGKRTLHVQVDLESSGYQQGPIRRECATVELTLTP